MSVAAGVAAALAAAASGRWGGTNPGTSGGSLCSGSRERDSARKLACSRFLVAQGSQETGHEPVHHRAPPCAADLLRAGLAGQAATGVLLFVLYLSVVPPVTWLAVSSAAAAAQRLQGRARGPDPAGHPAKTHAAFAQPCPGRPPLPPLAPSQELATNGAVAMLPALDMASRGVSAQAS